jgi:hypothetical protein
LVAAGAFVVADSARIHEYEIFSAWEAKQIKILKENSGNGFAPLPEWNPDYAKLVALGLTARPFLLEKLRDMSARPYRDDATYLSSLPRYVAYAIVDVSDWPRDDVAKQSKEYKWLEDYVLARCAKESATANRAATETK